MNFLIIKKKILQTVSKIVYVCFINMSLYIIIL